MHPDYVPDTHTAKGVNCQNIYMHSSNNHCLGKITKRNVYSARLWEQKWRHSSVEYSTHSNSSLLINCFKSSCLLNCCRSKKDHYLNNYLSWHFSRINCYWISQVFSIRANILNNYTYTYATQMTSRHKSRHELWRQGDVDSVSHANAVPLLTGAYWHALNDVGRDVTPGYVRPVLTECSLALRRREAIPEEHWSRLYR